MAIFRMFPYSCSSTCNDAGMVLVSSSVPRRWSAAAAITYRKRRATAAKNTKAASSRGIVGRTVFPRRTAAACVGKGLSRAVTLR